MDIFLLTKTHFHLTRHFISASLLLFSSIVLTACGGGSSGSDKPNPSSNQAVTSATLSSLNLSSVNSQATSSLDPIFHRLLP
jgi:hypothetical protein